MIFASDPFSVYEMVCFYFLNFKPQPNSQLKSKEFKMSIPVIPSATPYPYRVSPTDSLYSSLLLVLYRKQLFSCIWNTKEIFFISKFSLIESVRRLKVH
jgi:hypothetical protein